MQKILGPMRAAVEKYHMIGEGDRIAVGVSGGKDSLVLLCALAALREFYPSRFEVAALDGGSPVSRRTRRLLPD